MVDIRVSGADDLAKLAADLKRAGRTDLTKELRKVVKDAARPIAAEVKATTPSRQIAKSVTIEARLGKNPRVRVKADRKKMPPGKESLPALFERPKFRHPVFGDRETWVTQQGGPAFGPVARRRKAAVQAQILAAVDKVIRDLEAG